MAVLHKNTQFIRPKLRIDIFLIVDVARQYLVFKICSEHRLINDKIIMKIYELLTFSALFVLFTYISGAANINRNAAGVLKQGSRICQIFSQLIGLQNIWFKIHARYIDKCFEVLFIFIICSVCQECPTNQFLKQLFSLDFFLSIIFSEHSIHFISGIQVQSMKKKLCFVSKSV